MTERQPYKVESIMQFTEVVYYSADGEERFRRELYDVSVYDSGPPIELTEEEIEDYI